MSEINKLYYIIPLVIWGFITIFLYLNTVTDVENLDYIYEQKGSLLRTANFVVIAANVFIFIKVAVFFYENFGAKQFNVVLQGKADIMSEYLKYDENLQQQVIQYKGTNSDPNADDYVDPNSSDHVKQSEDYGITKETATILDEIRMSINSDNIKNKIDPWTDTFFRIFIFLIIWIVIRLGVMAVQNKFSNKNPDYKINDYKNVWNWKVDNFLLFMIVTAFTTELLFFFGIVRQYAFYGDQKIYSEIYNNINLNTISG
jgi:hypothetical protein